VTPDDRATWTATSDAHQLADWLAPFARVLLLTHAKPDGDAIGSTLALARALDGRAKRDGAPGHTATPWYDGPMPTFADKLVGPTRIKTTDKDGLPDPTSFDAVVVCDTGSWSQVETFAPTLRAMTDNAAIIDHHLQGAEDMAPRRLLAITAAAVCQPIADVCGALLGLDSPRQLPVDIATPIYMGLATDTGWFRHANVSPDAFRLAADLLEAGVDHAALYALSEQQDRAARAKLLGRALSNMELVHDNTVALLPVTLADFHAVGAGPGDTGGFTDPALAIATVKVAITLVEVRLSSDGPHDVPTHVKLSLRSKAGPDMVDVAELASKFGGGGHAQAAGARIEGTLDQARAKLIDALG